MQMTLERAAQLELNNNKEHDKNTLRTKGENALYARLKEKGKEAYGVMKIHDYVKMLKAEIEQEDAENQK